MENQINKGSIVTYQGGFYRVSNCTKNTKLQNLLPHSMNTGLSLKLINACNMIREKHERTGPIVIDLTGPDGNAFALIGLAQNLAKQLGYQPNRRGELTTEMMSGDYEHLLQVFDREFGNFVILER